MNFGEKLKKIRNEKNMTQPQLAEAIGIEQSYLSKLENDKSVPSAEMFQKVMAALEIGAKDFLQDIDKSILNGPLRQIPEVANFINVSAATRVHNVKKWLLGSAAACALGFALMLGADQGIFVSNKQFQYRSHGIILANESEDVFAQFAKVINLKEQAQILTHQEAAKALAEFEATRVRPTEIILQQDKGQMFFQEDGKGRRKFELSKTIYGHHPANRIIQFLGAIFMFCGVGGFFVEWRLRKLQAH